MAFSGQLSEAGSQGPVSFEIAADALKLGEQLIALTDIDDVHDDNYTMHLTIAGGRHLDLSMLGTAYGQVLADLKKARDAALEKDLLLKGVSLEDSFPGKLFGGGEPAEVELAVYQDLLVVRPQRGVMFGVPYSFIRGISWDEEQYQIAIDLDDGTQLRFGHLAKRSEEFRDELGRLLEALDERTARTLLKMMPAVGKSVADAIAPSMRDGRAVMRDALDRIDPSVWPALEGAVVATPELRSSYETLAATSVPGWIAFGIKAIAAEPEDSASGDEPPPETGRLADLWYFCPLARAGKPVNLLAQEVVSDSGHATYLFRIMEPAGFGSTSEGGMQEKVAHGIARLNRALLLLNFRREPIYLSEEEIATGPYARYKVALRKLDYLRWVRSAYVGRVIHNESWADEISKAIATA